MTGMREKVRAEHIEARLRAKRSKKSPTAEQLARYPVRGCRSLHACALCDEHITAGQRYHDGGLDRRAHVGCVEAGAQAEREDPRDEAAHAPDDEHHEREAAEVLEELEREPSDDPLAEWSISEGTLRALIRRVEARAREGQAS